MAKDYVEIIGRWRKDPEEFFAAVWPRAKLWKAQQQVVRSVRDNWGTLVHSAIEMGKDWIAARLMIWFYATRFPAKVLGTGPSLGQLKRTLWGEIDKALREAAESPWGSVVAKGVDQKDLWLRRLDPATRRPFADDWLQLHKSADVEAMSGIHLASKRGEPRVFIVLDECSGLRSKFCQALEGQAHRLLVLGNPLRLSGYYADKIRAGDRADAADPRRLRLRVIRIDARKSPNVACGRAWERKGKVGPCPEPMPGIMTWQSYANYESSWDSFNKSARLWGELPDSQEEHLVCPRAWLDEAARQWDRVRRYEDRGPYAMGVDPSLGRSDAAVWVVGDHLGIVDLVVKQPKDMRDAMGLPDTTKMADQTVKLMRKWGIPGRRVCVDAGGGGQTAIGDPLRKRGVVVRLIDFGGRPSRPKRKAYRNKRAELYGNLAERCDPNNWVRTEDRHWTRCVSLDMQGRQGTQLEVLVDELSLIPKHYDGEGKMYLPPKDRRRAREGEEPEGACLRAIIGHSPNHADAAALMFWALRRRRAGPPRVDRPLVYAEA